MRKTNQTWTFLEELVRSLGFQSVCDLEKRETSVRERKNVTCSKAVSGDAFRSQEACSKHYERKKKRGSRFKGFKESL